MGRDDGLTQVASPSSLAIPEMASKAPRFDGAGAE